MKTFFVSLVSFVLVTSFPVCGAPVLPPSARTSWGDVKSIFLYRLGENGQAEHLEIYPHGTADRPPHLLSHFGGKKKRHDSVEFKEASPTKLWFRGGSHTVKSYLGWEGQINLYTFQSSVITVAGNLKNPENGWRVAHAVSQYDGFEPLQRHFLQLTVRGAEVVDETPTVPRGFLQCAFSFLGAGAGQSSTNRDLVKQLRASVEAWLDTPQIKPYGIKVNAADITDNRGELYVDIPEWLISRMRLKFFQEIAFWSRNASAPVFKHSPDMRAIVEAQAVANYLQKAYLIE